MSLNRKNLLDLLSIFAVIILLLLPHFIFAQHAFKGRVVYKIGSTPAAFASVEVLNRKGIHTLSNNSGNFSLNIDNAKPGDTVVISSVGYTSIKLPLAAALKRTEFELSEIVKNMEAVTVFNSHEVVGSMSESVGFYRSWNYEHTGGEIGRIFKLPYKKFTIDKVRFKAGNSCDTCLLKVHIRKVVNGIPGEEILSDSISVLVNRLSLDSKVPEFDLTPYDLVFTESEFFVGVEVLNCGNGKKGFCAFNFAGTEKGEYFYKSTANKDWQSTDDYTIYLKLFLRF